MQIIITGIHRGMTTLLGSIFSVMPDGYLLKEPFNFTNGVSLVREWYPCDRHHLSILHSIEENKVLKYKYKVYQGKCFRNKLKSIIGNKQQINYLMYVMLFKNSNIIIKDPFLSLLVRKYYLPNFKIIFVYRNPYSFYESILRMGWDMDANLLNRIKGSPSNINTKIDLTTHIGRHIALWRYIYCDLKLYDNTYLFKDLEYLLNFEGTLRKICNDMSISHRDTSLIVNRSKQLNRSSKISNKTSPNVIRQSANNQLKKIQRLSRSEIDFIRENTEIIYSNIYTSRELSELHKFV